MKNHRAQRHPFNEEVGDLIHPWVEDDDVLLSQASLNFHVGEDMDWLPQHLVGEENSDSEPDSESGSEYASGDESEDEDEE